MEDTFSFGFLYIAGLTIVLILFFAAYWFSKFPEAVAETLNQSIYEDKPNDVP